MPHYSNYGGTYLSAQSFDELTGAFSALSETTNFRTNQGEEIGVIHPSYKPDPRGYEPGPVGSLSETFGDGDPKILGPISGEGVFKPQDIDTKGSVIVGDNHFTTGGGGDSITGVGRATNVWTNGSATSLEDRLDIGPVNKTADKGWWTVDGADFRDVGRAQFNEFPTFDLELNNRENSFVIEGFEPAAGMDSFGESWNPVLQDGGNPGPFIPVDIKKLNGNFGQMYSPLSGSEGCPF